MRSTAVRYVAGGLVAAVALVGSVVGLAALRDGDRTSNKNVTAGNAPTQTGDIAAIVDGKVVVLSSLDGAIARTLVEGDDAKGATDLAVSPDGKTLYFTRTAPDARCNNGHALQIVSVPIDGGPVLVVASGASPEPSPDGRFLAYAGSASKCGPRTELVVRALGSNQPEQRYDESGDPDVGAVEPLVWSGDSQRLVYSLLSVSPRDGTTDLLKQRLLEPVTGAPPRYWGIVGPGPSAYRGAEFIVALPQGLQTEVVAFDELSGAARLLFVLPPGAEHADATAVDVNATDNRILVVTPELPPPDPTGVLYLWLQGGQPTSVLDGVDDAAWIQQAPAPESEPSTTTTVAPVPVPPSTGVPEMIVVAIDERVAVLSTADGSVVRTLAEGEGISRVAVSADAKTVYFTRRDPDVLCNRGVATQIVSVPVEGGSPQIVASGSGAVLSPDGRRIAYATGGANQCGPANTLVVQELGGETLSQETFEGGDAIIVPVTWSPDSRSVLYSWQTTDDVQAREVEPGTNAPPRTLPVPDGTYQPTYLGTTETVAVVEDDGTSTRVLEVDANSGVVRRTLLTVPDRPAFRSLIADASGRHLLFTTFAAVTGGDRIWRWSDGGEPVVVLEASGELIQDAVWLVPTAA